MEDAIRTLRSTIDLRADWAEAHFMLGTALMLGLTAAVAVLAILQTLGLRRAQAGARIGAHA